MSEIPLKDPILKGTRKEGKEKPKKRTKGKKWKAHRLADIKVVSWHQKGKKRWITRPLTRGSSSGGNSFIAHFENPFYIFIIFLYARTRIFGVLLLFLIFSFDLDLIYSSLCTPQLRVSSTFFFIFWYVIKLCTLIPRKDQRRKEF